MEHGDFIYKLWLTKYFPWIDDISEYFTRLVCKEWIHVYMRPTEFDCTLLHIDGCNQKLMYITWYSELKRQDSRISNRACQSYRILVKYDKVHDWKSNNILYVMNIIVRMSKLWCIHFNYS